MDPATTSPGVETISNDSSIGYALRKLGVPFSIDQLKNGQRKSMEAFLDNRDAMVILPTGHGKSLIYQSAPYLHDFSRHSSVCSCKEDDHVPTKSIAVIVSPLIALMKDQVASLKRSGVTALYIGETTAEEDVLMKEGRYSLLFSSPEGILSARGTRLLTSAVYRNNVCGIFVDESHCIVKW